jgi:hypothetical protein
MTDIEICHRDVYIRDRTLRLGVPRPNTGEPDIRTKGGSRAVIEGDEGRGRVETNAMTTEILSLAGQIGHWVNALVARQIAAQAAKLPH